MAVPEGDKGREFVAYRVVAFATLAAFALAASAAFADGIDPGLWKITGRTETGRRTNRPNA